MLISKFIVIVTLFGLAASIIEMDPINPKLRSGQALKMLCKVPSSITNCFWTFLNKNWIPFKPPRKPSFGNLEDGECGWEGEITTTRREIDVCCVINLSNNPIPNHNCTSVHVVVLPKIQLESEFDKNGKITVMAGEESMLTCIVTGAQPKPDVLWKIGNPIRNQFVY